MTNDRVSNKRNLYCLDSGSTTSQTNSLNELENIRPLKRCVQVANGEHLNTQAQGELGAIKNISYTPGISKLLSERMLINQGYGYC
jgi:hypothetical protein